MSTENRHPSNSASMITPSSFAADPFQTPMYFGRPSATPPNTLPCTHSHLEVAREDWAIAGFGKYCVDASSLFPTVPKAVAIPLLLVVALSPLLSMLIFITGTHNVFVAMLVMHWLCMVTLPCLYIACLVKSLDYYRSFWRRQRSRMRSQWRWGVPGFFCTSCVVFGAYLFAKCNPWNAGFCVKMKDKALHEGFQLPTWSLIAFGVYFVIFNPVVEECFWRVFLYRELGGHLFLHAHEQVLFPAETAPLLGCNLCPETPSIASSTSGFVIPSGKDNVNLCSKDGAAADVFPCEDDAELYSETIGVRCKLDQQDSERLRPSEHSQATPPPPLALPPFFDLRLSVLGQFLMSCLYASYHFCVIFHLLGLGCAFLIFLVLVNFGVLLIFVRNRPKLGILTAMLLHAGVDFGAVLAYANVFFKFV
eukprot:GHVS01054700.1.p1 GENE.GHVS01054700.1~~GHVS01054700.1.p1  ORF type:complete len:421 (-),score=34.97 GHVS01054700.1:12-1274(-)